MALNPWSSRHFTVSRCSRLLSGTCKRPVALHPNSRPPLQSPSRYLARHLHHFSNVKSLTNYKHVKPREIRIASYTIYDITSHFSTIRNIVIFYHMVYQSYRLSLYRGILKGFGEWWYSM